MDGALVGRETELRRLSEAFAAGRAGRGTVVPVIGAPGIGKSALVRAALERRPAGAALLAGRGHPRLRTFPYAALVPALRMHLDRLPDPARVALFDDLPALAQVLVDDAVPAGPRTSGAPSVRLLESLTLLVLRIASASGQAVLWIDDAQDADADSLALVGYLAQRCGAHPLTILVSSSASIAGIDDRDGLRVGPLADPAMTDLVGRLAPELDPGDARRIVDLAAGVPGYAVALAADLASDPDPAQLGDDTAGDDTPLGSHARAVADRRGAGLGAGERDVLEILATAPRAVGVAALTAMLADPSTFDHACRALHGAGLVARRPSPAGPTFAITHPLDRRAVAAGLGDLRRRALHLRHLEVLTSRSAADVRDRAWHHRRVPGAFPPDEVVPVLLDAARAALDAGAAGEAVLALEAADAIVAPSSPDAYGAVAHRLADALYRSGRPHRARDTLMTAIGALPGGDARLSPLQDLLALIHSDLQEDERSARILRAVTTGAPSVAPSTTEQLAHRLFLVTRSADSQDTAAVAAELARFANADDPEQRAVGLVGAAMSAFAARDIPAARALAEQALDLSRADVVWGAASREAVRACFLLGDLPAVRTILTEDEARAHRMGPLAVEASHRSSNGLLDLLAGDVSAALKRADAGLRLARRSATARVITRCLLASALVGAEVGATDEATAALAEAQRTGSSPLHADVRLSRTSDCVRALLYLGHQATTAPDTAAVPRVEVDWFVLTMHPLLTGRVAVATDRLDHARTEEDYLRAFGAPAVVPVALAERLAGLRAIRADDPRAGLALLDVAGGALERVGLRLLAAQVRVEGAEAAVAASLPVARGEPQELVAFFDERGVRPWAYRARRVARALGVRVPGPRTGGGALTARETEVARLAAAGHSNAQIAQALFLSERTVETHLRHIYARLGLDTRVALARFFDGLTR